jgi:uncharacterized membrane protein YgdD (TMEM256/DUF423 family)
MTKTNRYIILGAVFCALTVGIGAFGSHGLKDVLTSNGRTDTFETGIRYMFVSFIGMIISGMLHAIKTTKATNYAGILLALGGWIFGGSLIGLSVTNILWLGAVAPLGGLAMMAGWLMMAFSQKQ